ncbi:hypothetical protein M8C21_002053, partial [Ambrosia artemisiifolia]
QTTVPPPLTTTTTTIDSSPRSRTIDSWVETTSPFPTPIPTPNLRLMCSSGGHIVPRPHDKSLCYVGGDTRIVVVDRHTTLSSLTNRLTKTLLHSSSPTTSFTIKYLLPSEDLDSLISLTTDEDLDNMIDEYDRLNVNADVNVTSSSSRIRLFLFPDSPESVSSIGSVLETATKSEDWFLNALNGTTSCLSDTSSVNCLLGLEGDVAVLEKKDVSNNNNINNNNKNVKAVQDVQSVADSPMLETTSSFGSASSTPSLVVSPVTVNNVDDQQKVKREEDVSVVAEPVLVVVTDNVNVITNRVSSEDEIILQQQYQPKASVDSGSSDGSTMSSLSSQKPPVIYQDPSAHTQFPTHNIIDQNSRIQIQQQIKDSAYLTSSPPTPVDPQNPQMHHQPQFVHTAVPPPQYLHHHPSGAVSMPPFYQIYPSQTPYHAPHPALGQQNMVYYMPARQPPQGYNLPLQADASPAVSLPPNSHVPPPSGLITVPPAVQSIAKTEAPAGVYRTATNSAVSAPQVVQVPSSYQQIQPQFVGYSHIRQPVASGASGGNIVYEFANPSQQGQHVYYAAQPLPPQSAAQYQTIASTLPVEAQPGSHLPA